MPLAALKRLGSSLLTPRSQSPTDGASKVTKETLFPPIPSDDDCNHDCAACPVSDGTGSGYGRAFDKIGTDSSDPLWGQVKAYGTHAIVATGKTDWIRDVEDIKGSVMAALAAKKKAVDNGRLMISASNLPPPQEYFEAHGGEGRDAPTDVILLPAFTVLEGVTPADADEIVRCYINPGPTSSTLLPPPPPLAEEPAVAEDTPAADPAEIAPTSAPSTTAETALSTTLPTTLKSHPYPHAFLILICSHRHRDARCGISAPILSKEFEKHLRSVHLWRDHSDRRPGGASVVFINHVGGHKYSANVIIYRKEDGQGIWLARVAPRHVEGIVKHTIVEGRVNTEMVRGGFNRRTGATSW
ncbi:Sucrase/ferredoxin-like-domain-containing protein [Tricharina praecox]|uniref:Sucrase/ferredoxin-like-domain-containing protein n=1 Tax=Tricharina praecox TaxID=43433 RepID=UPI00221E4CE6|nr:Sucrase/ferredoxin-like-domain-containing protein [Tricharina praecox]KAI5859136.1 Sucrase/ferredoxin-like-domain-containing protein [Tricharina praecox]